MSDRLDQLLNLNATSEPPGRLEGLLADNQDVPAQRSRALAQGMTFGSADEAEAWARSTFLGEDYDAALEDVRGKLKDYREDSPWASLGYEAGGAALPTIVASLFTGGTGGAAAGGATAARMAANYPMLARLGTLLGVGAVEGGTYAFNTGEGGFANRLDRVPGGMTGGAAGAAVGAAGSKAIGAGLRKLTDVARRNLGSRAASVVEREIRKAAADSGKTVQEAVDDVVNGRILAENKTIASVARAWRAQSAEADRVLREGIEGRPNLTRNDMMETLQTSMGAKGNALRQFNMTEEAAEKAKSADYNRIWARGDLVDDDTAQELVNAYRRVPRAAKDLEELYRAQTGSKPFFKVTDEGIEMARNPTVQEAEIMRRSLNQYASNAYGNSKGALGGAVREVEEGVRGRIDDASPDLARTRAEWSNIKANRDAFNLGLKSLVSPDQAEIDFAQVTEMGDDAVKAYRAGVATALRRQASTGSRKSLPRNIVEDETRQGRVVRMAAPDDDLPQIIDKAERAAGSQEASNIILGGSPTSITDGRIAEQGISAAETVLDASSMSPAALLRLAGSLVKSTSPQLSPAQAAEAARLVVETDPDVVARALTDRSALDALYNLTARVTQTVERSSRSSGAVVGAGTSTGGGLLSMFPAR